jgi:hypothetical protein
VQVWDNWAFEDVTKFVLDPSCIDVVEKIEGGAQQVANAFMERNRALAKRNFGSQADNATGVIVYISLQRPSETS